MKPPRQTKATQISTIDEKRRNETRRDNAPRKGNSKSNNPTPFPSPDPPPNRGRKLLWVVRLECVPGAVAEAVKLDGVRVRLARHLARGKEVRLELLQALGDLLGSELLRPVDKLGGNPFSGRLLLSLALGLGDGGSGAGSRLRVGRVGLLIRVVSVRHQMWIEIGCDGTWQQASGSMVSRGVIKDIVRSTIDDDFCSRFYSARHHEEVAKATLIESAAQSRCSSLHLPMSHEPMRALHIKRTTFTCSRPHPP